MHILHIITGLGDGGAEAVLYRMCKFDKEFKHTVISLGGQEKYVSMLKNLDISVHALDFSNKTINLYGLYKLYKHIRKIKPDVVQTWMQHADLIGGVIAKLAGIKNIFWGVHYAFLIREHDKKINILIYRINIILSHILPKKIIYCAYEAKKAQENNGFCKRKGLVIQNGYDYDNFIKDRSAGLNFRNEIGVDNDVFLIGHVGRYDPNKDLTNLICAVSLLNKSIHKYKVVLVGTDLDNNNSFLLSLLHDHKVSDFVYLLGRRSDIPAVMNGIDLFALSSKSEAFPNVLNESMLCCTPCVTTDVGDAGKIVGSYGWVVKPEDPAFLADGILKAMDEKNKNTILWQNRGDNCRQRIIQNYSLHKMVSSYKKEWLQVLK